MWTAVSLALIVGVGLLAYTAFALHAVAGGASVWPFIVGLPLAYLAVPFALACVWIAMGEIFRAQRPPEVRLSLSGRVRYFLQEFFALARSAPRMIAYRWLMPDPLPAPARHPVLLVHGLGCNAGVWTGMRADLERRGLGPVYAISYGPPLASIELFAEQLDARIDAVLAATGAAQVLLVAHSMGGLVGRAYLRRHGGAKVHRLITLGTPHAGSRHAWMMGGTSLGQIRPGNSWLTELAADPGHAAGVPLISIWSWHDSMVTPQTSSRLPWAKNVTISGVAHNAMLNDRDVWSKVATEIAAATSECPG